MELLSPAGSMDCLAAAVQNGADAVYFGGGSFNARRYADNFVGDGLARAIDYCHERGVRAYITLNTLIFDREMDDAVGFAYELHRLGADAVLVQDIGLAGIIRRELPKLTLHASTQMGIHDMGGLAFCRQLGIKRAVLAREVSLETIKYLASHGGVELECFAHGALCMSFSGSCLYSSMSGERSGNRGTCAQPCRKRACVNGRPGERDFCLSPNDICMIEHLGALRDAGVACIKLEGRMKKPEYVALATRAYRSALDGADGRELARLKTELFGLFNRGNFNTAHYFSDSVRTDRVGSSRPDDELVKKARERMTGEHRKRPVNTELSLAVGERALLRVKYVGNGGKTEEFTLRGAEVRRAERPQSAELYAGRLAKLGDTPFVLADCLVSMDEDCYLSAAELNGLRRDAVSRLLEALHVRNDIPQRKSGAAVPGTHPAPADGRNKKLIYVRTASVKAAGLAFENGADIVAVEPVTFETEQFAALQGCRAEGKKLLLALPNAVMGGTQQRIVHTLLDSGLFDGAEANNIGQTAETKRAALRVAGIGMNALNSYSVDELLNLNYDFIMPSPELTRAQLMPIAERYGGRLLMGVHGRTPLMQLLHCPVREHGGCRGCTGDAGSVTDEDGRVFPLVNTRFPDKCLVRMLNCHTTDLIDLYESLPPCAGFVLSFTGEPDGMVPERLSALSDAMNGRANVPPLPGATRGHFNRKVD